MAYHGLPTAKIIYDLYHGLPNVELKKIEKGIETEKKSRVLFSHNALPFFGFLTVEWEEREERKAEVSLLPGMRPLS